MYVLLFMNNSCKNCWYWIKIETFINILSDTILKKQKQSA